MKAVCLLLGEGAVPETQQSLQAMLASLGTDPATRTRERSEEGPQGCQM